MRGLVKSGQGTSATMKGKYTGDYTGRRLRFVEQTMKLRVQKPKSLYGHRPCIQGLTQWRLFQFEAGPCCATTTTWVLRHSSTQALTDKVHRHRPPGITDRSQA